MQLPSVDIFIGLAFLLGIAYGFILKREKTITALCSVYVGLVIASTFSDQVFKFFNGNAIVANSIWIRSNASLSTISIVLFLLSIFFISGAISSHTNSSKNNEVSPMEVIIYMAFTMALIISSILIFLPEATTNNYIATSTTAKILLNYRTFWVIGAPVMIVLLNIRSGKK